MGIALKPAICCDSALSASRLFRAGESRRRRAKYARPSSARRNRAERFIADAVWRIRSAAGISHASTAGRFLRCHYRADAAEVVQPSIAVICACRPSSTCRVTMSWRRNEQAWHVRPCRINVSAQLKHRPDVDFLRARPFLTTAHAPAYRPIGGQPTPVPISLHSSVSSIEAICKCIA